MLCPLLSRLARFVHQYDIACRELTLPSQICGDTSECRLAIKRDVRWISAVMPLRKLRIICLKVGHHSKPTTRKQHSVQLPKFQARLMEMLRSFCACDEVVIAFKFRGVCVKNRVIQMHLVSFFCQHLRKRRTGAASIIQANLRRRQLDHQRINKSAEKIQISPIVRIIVVLGVSRDFFAGRWEVRICKQCCLAMRTTPICFGLDHRKGCELSLCAHSARWQRRHGIRMRTRVASQRDIRLVCSANLRHHLLGWALAHRYN